jgi:hypothetical protein
MINNRHMSNIFDLTMDVVMEINCFLTYSFDGSID